MNAWIIHNGDTILEASEDFYTLFRCDSHSLVDRTVEDIIADGEFRALARLRGHQIMLNDDDREYSQEYAFLRFDGTSFWGRAISKKSDQGEYTTRIKFEYEIR